MSDRLKHSLKTVNRATAPVNDITPGPATNGTKRNDFARLLCDALFMWEAPDNDAQDAAPAESLPAEGGLDDQLVLDPAERRNAMLTVDAIATLVPAGAFTDDELTDLIAAVVDYLDDRVIDPSISTIREETGVRVEVSVTIDTDDPWQAQALAAAAMRDAFDNFMPAVSGMTHRLVLQAA